MTGLAPIRDTAIQSALKRLSLEDKVRLLSGQDMWSLPAIDAIGLASIVMSDGPVGVRGTLWSASAPSIALPSPTALAATWDPGLARQAGRLLGQEARRKGVHVLLAPTVNLHRSPLGGRHFEAYSEDPLLTAAIGTGFVRGVQDQGVATTVKHFVANDVETDRFNASSQVSDRALRELYLAPFEAILRGARPWGVMSAYNAVNGVSMTVNGPLQRGVLKDEWGFDGVIVSDGSPPGTPSRPPAAALTSRCRRWAARGACKRRRPWAQALSRSRSSTSRYGGCCGWPPGWAHCNGQYALARAAARPPGSDRRRRAGPPAGGTLVRAGRERRRHPPA